MPVWIVFLLSAAAVVAAGARLSRDGDTIAERTGLGGAWVGAILLAGATSLPELATGIYAVRSGAISLAIGDIFGSCMGNLMILGVADLCVRKVGILNRVAVNQVLVGVLGMILLAVAAAGIVAPLNFSLLNWGWAPLAIGLTYFLGMRLLHVNRGQPPFETADEAKAHAASAPSLRTAIIGFAISAGVILFAARYLATSAEQIAGMLGLSSGFVGMVLLALVTSLPEATVSVAAVRSGSYDLAVGNLLGSNCFNVTILFVHDWVDGPLPILAKVGPGLLVGALFAIILTGQAVLGILNRSERRIWFLEPDAVFLLLTYGAGLYLAYVAGH
jgi:cation:H+ antiporter